jgi:membrane protein YqaA with SNARE-associated domain
MGLAASRHAGRALGFVAFIEGIFFPVPADILLMPVALANRDKAMRYAGITTVCSILGGSVGYMVGRFLQPVGRWLLSLTGHADALDQIKNAAGPWIAAVVATPIPYKITAIGCGLFGVSFPLFIGVSIVVRGLRYGIECALIKRYGAPIQAFIEKHMGLVAGAIGVVVVLLAVALKVYS